MLRLRGVYGVLLVINACIYDGIMKPRRILLICIYLERPQKGTQQSVRWHFARDWEGDV